MAKQLEERMASLQKKAVTELGEESDVLITTFIDGHCGSIMRGNAQNIAHSMFALIHGDNKVGIDLYRVIKLVVLNIIGNESPFAADLLTSILNAPTPTEESENAETGKKAMIVQMNRKDEKD